MRTALKIALIRTGRTQRDIARQLGLSENQLSLIVRGVKNPTAEIRRALAEVVGEPESEVFKTE